MWFDNRLSKRFDNRRYRVNKHPTGCQTGCTTGCIVQTGYKMANHWLIFSERNVSSRSLCCRPSVSVVNARAPYSGGCNFP